MKRHNAAKPQPSFANKKHGPRVSFHSNRIPLPFEKIVEGMLQLKREKKSAKKPRKKK
jgi:hypothetical protein